MLQTRMYCVLNVLERLMECLCFDLKLSRRNEKNMSVPNNTKGVDLCNVALPHARVISCVFARADVCCCVLICLMVCSRPKKT